MTRGRQRERLLKRRLQIRARSQGCDLKPVRIRLGHTERAPPNRTRRSQDGNSFHDESSRYRGTGTAFSFYALLACVVGGDAGRLLHHTPSRVEP